MFKFLIIFFAVIYIGGLIGRWFLKKWVNNLSQTNQQKSAYTNKKEGEVTIDYDTKPKKQNNVNDEYVDFEEVE